MGQYDVMSNLYQNRNPRGRLNQNVSSYIILGALVQKLMFSRWCQQPSWIWPSGGKCQDFFRRTWAWGLNLLYEVHGHGSQLSNFPSQRMVAEL